MDQTNQSNGSGASDQKGWGDALSPDASVNTDPFSQPIFSEETLEPEDSSGRGPLPMDKVPGLDKKRPLPMDKVPESGEKTVVSEDEILEPEVVENSSEVSDSNPEKAESGKTDPEKAEPEKVYPEKADSGKIEPEKSSLETPFQESFQDKVKDVLQDANIGVKQIVSYCAGCLVLILVIIGLIYGGKFLFQKMEGDKSSDKTKVLLRDSTKEVLPQEPSEEVSEGAPSYDDALRFAVLVGLEFGSSIDFQDPSLTISFILGAEKERFQKRFVQQIDFLQEMHNAAKTDVFQMLDQSREREKALQEYKKTLEDMYDDGRAIRSEIDNLIQLMEVRFNNNLESKSLYEERFFEYIRDLNGEKTEEMLSAFIEISKEQVDTKARFKALSKLKSYYETVLGWIDRRLKVIDLNIDAFIQGVHVVDVEGADLELIVPLENFLE